MESRTCSCISPATPSFTHEADVTEKVIRDGKVDTDALSALERDGKPELAATGYFLAGKHESDGGNFPRPRAISKPRSAFSPTTPPY